MSIINIQPSPKKEDLTIQYGEGLFKLSGEVPVEYIEALTSVPFPVSKSEKAIKDYEERLATILVNAFLTHVMPEDFKKAIQNFDDVMLVWEAWDNYVNSKKSSASVE